MAIDADSPARWQRLPVDVRDEVELQLRQRVTDAATIAHGSAAVALRLRLENGSSVFFKGVASASANEFMQHAIWREESIYRRLAPRIQPYAPTLLGSAKKSGWQFLLLEWIGAWDAPPWSVHTLSSVATGFARFHHQNEKIRPPAWLGEMEWRRFARSWQALEEDADYAWLARNHDRLHACASRLASNISRRTILHLDARSDNMVVHDGQLRLFDWAQAGVGPPEFDVAALVQSIAAEGGPEPVEFLRHYRRLAPLDSDLLLASVSGIAGYFWSQVLMPPIPEVPHLRAMQRNQLAACLEWLSAEGICESPIGLHRLNLPV